MSRPFEIEDPAGRRTAEAADFPLTVGGGDADLQLPHWQDTVAWLGLDAGDLFVQPEGEHPVRVDGTPVTTSHWLQAGDQVDFGDGLLRVDSTAQGLFLRLSAANGHRRAAPTAKPVQAPPAGRPIAPVTFSPARSAVAGAEGGRRLLPRLLASVVVALLGVLAFFLFTARSVEIRVSPEPDRLVVEGGLFSPLFAERRLMRPGEYTVIAEKAGFRTLTAPLVIGPDARQVHSYDLLPLPGRLALTAVSGSVSANEEEVDAAEEVVLDESGFASELSEDLVELPEEADVEPFSAEQAAQLPGALGAEIEIDGAVLGTTPAELELEPGEYRLRVTAERHHPFETRVEIEGQGTAQRLDLVLAPRWADVHFESRPEGARLLIDGEPAGTTPVTVELLEGVRRYQLSRAGFAPRSGALEVVAGEDQTIGPVAMKPSDGNLQVTSQPAGTAVTVDGVYRGETPLELKLAPRREHRLRFSKTGFEGAEQVLELAADEARDLHVVLEAQRGDVVVSVFPPDAAMTIDGEVVQAGRLSLAAAVTHRVLVEREGYVPFETEIVPLADHEKTLDVRLEALGAARERKIRELTQTSEGQRLQVIEPGRFRMGASRREPGRRANETQREIELTRRFYLSATEVSNAEFRRFRPDHRSGTVGGRSLDLDDHPVVQISWQDAAAYCNWLSAKEGLRPAYVPSGTAPGAPLVAAPRDGPHPDGYRLPTEAEWAWAARYQKGEGEAAKYPWGESLPVAEKAGNFADRSAADLVSATLADYHDGFPATAPVDAFGPDARGLYQLSGNVAEWIHDVYVVRPAMVGAVERDPEGPRSGDFHVIRGASWMHSTITELRLSFRDYGAKPRPDVGFRLVRPIP